MLYENRVLQTGIVRGPVISTVDSAIRDTVSRDLERAAHIDFVLSGVVGRASGDLSARSRFDAALVLNDLGGGHGLHSVAGNDARYIVVSDKTISGAVDKIHEDLDLGLWDLREFNDLHAPQTESLLRDLALFGNRIFAFLQNQLSPSVLNAQKLQVVIAHRDARFPLEFIYAFQPPADNAPICPHAAEALRTGTCAQDCAARTEIPAPVVCPLGFWGFNRVIEWHAFKTERSLELPASAVARLDDFDACSRTSEAFIDGACLFAYSKEIDKADVNSISAFQERSLTLTEQPVLVESWPEWKERVRELNPGLLFLLVHTKVDGARTRLEMGPPTGAASEAEYLLGTDNLTPEYVYGPKVTGTPIVMLLGCTTGRAADVSFDTVAAAIEDRTRAGIIIATTNLVYGPKAVEIAEKFLRKLATLEDGQSFGDVMLAVRREALADGMTMILCITAYGDADWKLVRRTPGQA